DCAHTMGASWNGRRSGSFGLAACFSMQTYKHINSGEGGFVTSDDAELMARAIIHSGSYMLYERHEAAPDPEVFETIRLETPNYSGRMDNLRAAILRPQLAVLDEQCERWNERYRAVEDALRGINGLTVPVRPSKEKFVGSSIQFLTDSLEAEAVPDFVERCRARGVELKWFGANEPAGYTSRHDSWQYVDAQTLPQTDRVLSKLCDMRIPLTFSVEDCRQIGEIIRDVFEHFDD
ncbi:MAG: DegT/DnrJ/EryC1/StrS family aminotransferase, partial [Hyphomicrobiales bacterium]|nr:DegT/DnrJ/EryC1/StrS family aminotransferase [Hyphomicrobiales bacterium]